MEAGLENLSMSALVDRAGVSLRTVYNYFEAKDSLVDALQAETLTRMDEQGIVYVDTLDHMPETIRLNRQILAHSEFWEKHWDASVWIGWPVKACAALRPPVQS